MGAGIGALSGAGRIETVGVAVAVVVDAVEAVLLGGNTTGASLTADAPVPSYGTTLAADTAALATDASALATDASALATDASALAARCAALAADASPLPAVGREGLRVIVPAADRHRAQHGSREHTQRAPHESSFVS
jgi:hypothetical protein